MKTVDIEIKNLESLDEAAHKFMAQMGDYTVYAFYGQMGAAQRVDKRGLARALGVESDPTNSPSFAIINEYRSDTTAELIYHFDCYRLENEREAEDLGAEDYFDSGSLCLIEWPERIEGLLPDDTVRIDLNVNPDESRTLRMTFPDD